MYNWSIGLQVDAEAYKFWTCFARGKLLFLQLEGNNMYVFVLGGLSFFNSHYVFFLIFWSSFCLCLFYFVF